jgi:hypothetical protein
MCSVCMCKQWCCLSHLPWGRLPLLAPPPPYHPLGPPHCPPPSPHSSHPPAAGPPHLLLLLLLLAVARLLAAADLLLRVLSLVALMQGHLAGWLAAPHPHLRAATAGSRGRPGVRHNQEGVQMAAMDECMSFPVPQ